MFRFQLPVLLWAATVVFPASAFPSTTLNGEWKIATDPQNRGKVEKWFERAAIPEAKPCHVPGILEQSFPGYDGVVWYWKEFVVAPAQRNERVLLKFSAADYLAEVWLNGVRLGSHEGGETPFQFDVTKQLSPGSNRLAVRLLNPGKERVDGMTLDETPHGIKDAAMRVGNFWNPAGLWQAVELINVPAVRVDDVFVSSHLNDGGVVAHVSIVNATGTLIRARLRLTVTEDREGSFVTETVQPVSIPSSGTSLDLKARVEKPHPWSTQDPYLYRVAVNLEALAGTHHREVRTGFREFTFRDGYFRLNGKRIFLRGTHSVGHFPIGQHVPHDPELLRRELIYVKTMGFNMVRWLGRTMFPSQLDLCDELGLMVYQESYASWRWTDSPAMKERFDSAVREMILRDRSHVSLVAWGLLNETRDGPIFQHAAGMLPLVRSVDPTRMVILSSGRWDGHPSIGSLANPGDRDWMHAFGLEAPNAPSLGSTSAAWRKSGDHHTYPPRPWSPETTETIRTLGAGTKNIFLSEYGNGSQIDPIDITKAMEQNGARTDFDDYLLYKAMRDKLVDDWRRWGLDMIFASPSDMITEGQRMQSEQRLIALNAIRSNPKLAGYSLTGLSDQAIEGEGLMTIFRDLKPGIVDAMTDGFAPLRWCVFAEPAHLYRGGTLHVEAVLANEDRLSPGDHTVRLRVVGPGVVLLDKTAVLKIPDPKSTPEPPMVFPAFLEDVHIEGPIGRYEVAVSFDRGVPTLGRQTVIVGDRPAPPKMNTRVLVAEAGDTLTRALGELGITADRFRGEDAGGKHDTIMVGAGASKDIVQKVFDAVTRGSAAVFLDPSVLLANEKEVLNLMPVANKPRLVDSGPRFWGRDDIVKPHAIFEGLPSSKLMDLFYYRDLIPYKSFTEFGGGVENVVPAFSVGRPHGAGYWAGSNLLAYRLGEGKLVLSTLNLIDNLGKHPAADRITINLVKFLGDRQ
ncbi:MAG: sugar-binding domain-containing protein [Bryobacteraceae bacterium]